LSENVSAIIIFDVTRTTKDIVVTDTSTGAPLNVSYFEGSRYTAFLKMAEIKYSINENLDLKAGQLLNTQYLTFIDKFWAYRYIYVTFQEAYRFGNPADFGMQLDFKNEKYLNSISVVNGEGPFRHQDENGTLLISNNLQYYPVKGLTLKLYADYAPSPDETTSISKSAISAFIGYKHENYRIGGEYNYVRNYGFMDGIDYYGASLYGTYKLKDNLELLARWDYINQSIYVKERNFIIIGYQYQPVKNYFMSINIRHLMPDGNTQLYVNLGIKF
ncbi:MAG: hypothetical protein KAQ75_06710, partial [Bacteroidales bacterium]|nr:hypothetical protein [Bacteroidales bacterium]